MTVSFPKPHSQGGKRDEKGERMGGWGGVRETRKERGGGEVRETRKERGREGGRERRGKRERARGERERGEREIEKERDPLPPAPWHRSLMPNDRSTFNFIKRI